MSERICSVEGCDREHSAKSYCRKHYKMFRKHDDPLWGERVRMCSIVGCPEKHSARGYCMRHYQSLIRRGDPLSAKRIQRNPESYSAVHSRVKKHRGQAADHVCTCGSIAENWCYDHSDPNELRDPDHGSPYSLDISRYMPLCLPCHTAFDRGK